MPRTIPPSHRRRRIRVAVLGLTLVAVPVLGFSASAATVGAVTPYVDCIVKHPDTGMITVYYGYDNTGDAVSIPFGDSNMVLPGIQFQGQPTVFNSGNYPRVLSVTYSPAVFNSEAWLLGGATAVGTDQSPVCASGVTSPATLIGASAATLTGVVVPEGLDTTYHFEWGATSSLGSTTMPASTGASGAPLLVQASLTGLAPNTKYYYRLDTSNGAISGQGQIQTFTTTRVPPLSLGAITLPAGRVGVAYRATLTATGGLGPHTWSLVKGSLPAGLTLNRATGVISGIPKAKTSRYFTISVSDSSSPKRLTVTGRFAIRIAK